MNSSGIKRGLATTAISALAVVGLPALAGSASAQPLADSMADSGLELVSQGTGNASTQNDGVNSTVHLVARAGKDVKQVRFGYTVGASNANVQTIATVDRANGGFSHEWAPPANLLGAQVKLLVVGIDAAGNEIPTLSPASRTVTLGAGSAAVDIANPAGSEVGVFTEPYSHNSTARAIISGTTSSDTAPSLSTINGAKTTVDSFASEGDVRAFTGTVDLTGYTWSQPVDGVTPADEAVIVAEAGSDDAELVTLYQQTISEVTAEASPALVQGSSTSTATVTVLDQKGAPVAGARVFHKGQPGNSQLTNSSGQVSFGGLNGSADGTPHAFVVDMTDEVGYQSGTDFERSVTVTSYEADVTSIEASSKDGSAFDFDEFEPGDIHVTASDQHGAETSAGVRGSWTIKPFDPEVAEQTVAADINDAGDIVSLPGNTDGTYTLNTWIEQDGTPGQSAGDLSGEPLTFKAGEASITFENKLVQVQSGTATTQKGTLALADGTALGGRTATVTFTKAAGGDAKLAANQPEGTTRVDDSTATVKTAADGTFSVVVADVAVVAPADQPSELPGTLDAASTDLDVSADDTDDLTVEFLDLAVTDITFGGVGNLVDDKATPGRPVSYTVTVKNKDGELLKNAQVDLALDHGFFTTYADDEDDLKPASGPAVGDLYGVWKDEGSTKSVTTDENGEVNVTVAIARDAGFDDDGAVDAKLTVTSGDERVDQITQFTSADPLNPGELSIDLADGNPASLPNAQSGSAVLLDVFVKDQFGNLTNESVDVSDDTDAARVNWRNGVDTVQGQFEEGYSQVVATTRDNTDATQTITIDWIDAATNVWADADANTAGVQGVRDSADTDVSDTADAINWYSIDYVASGYTLTSNVEGDQVPGKTVIVTFTALDQQGNPIVGRDIDLFRSGPDALQSGEAKENVAPTDANGQTRYIFQGATEGTAAITAVLRDDQGRLVPESTKELEVVFANPVVEPPVVEPPTKLKGIVAKLTGKHNGKKADKVKVKAPKAAKGAKVVVYRVVKGKLKKVAAGKLNKSGNKAFRIKDRNGKKVTKYVAKVRKTSVTKADRTNVRRIR